MFLQQIHVRKHPHEWSIFNAARLAIRANRPYSTENLRRERNDMRASKYFALLAPSALILSIGAFAEGSNSGKFDLQQPARIGPAILQPGPFIAAGSVSSA